MVRLRRVGPDRYAVFVDGRRVGYVQRRSAIGERPIRWSYQNGSGEDIAIRYNRSRTAAVQDLLSWAGYSRTMYGAPTNRPAARRAAAQATVDPRSRYFGIEMELTGPDPRTIITALQPVIALDPINISTMRPFGYQGTNGSYWQLKSDSSVHGGDGYSLELVSPKLRGEEGLRQVQEVCRVLNEIGAGVNTSTGLHVHHDMRGFTAEQIRTQVLAYVERQATIFRLVAPSRRNNHYCGPWGPYDVQQLRDLSGDGRLLRAIGPRGAINLHAYPSHGSVEIRCHAGTTNFKKIRAWVRFGQALFAAAMAGTQVGGTDNIPAADTTTTDRYGRPVSTGRFEDRAVDPTQMLADLAPHGLTAEDASWLLRFERVQSGETRRQVEARVAAMRAEADATESVLEEMQTS